MPIVGSLSFEKFSRKAPPPVFKKELKPPLLV
jgi:hypothetical protein